MPKIFEIGGCVRDELLGIHTKDIDFTFVLDDLTKSVDEGWDLMLEHLKSEGFKIFLETKDCFTVRAQFPKDHKHEGLIADFVMARKEIGYKKQISFSRQANPRRNYIECLVAAILYAFMLCKV